MHRFTNVETYLTKTLRSENSTCNKAVFQNAFRRMLQRATILKVSNRALSGSCSLYRQIDAFVKTVSPFWRVPYVLTCNSNRNRSSDFIANIAFHHLLLANATRGVHAGSTSFNIAARKRRSASFRHNIWTNDWVAFPGDTRKQRPKESVYHVSTLNNGRKGSSGQGAILKEDLDASAKTELTQEHDANCIFCQQHALSQKLLSVRMVQSANNSENESYSQALDDVNIEIAFEGPGPCTADDMLVVLPNKYPVVSQTHCILEPSEYGPDAFVDDPLTQCEQLTDCFRIAQAKGGIKTSVDAVGFHEMIVDSRRHHLPMAEQSALYWRVLFTAFRERLRKLMHVPLIQSILCFKNVGSLGGASVSHPHSQLVALPIIPAQQLKLHECAQRYHDMWRKCVICDYINFELQEQTRVLDECDELVAVVPYAAVIPYQVIIFPKRHSHQFAFATDAMVLALGQMLASVFLRLDCLLKNPHYNLVLKNSYFPKNEECEQVNPESFYHWHVEIYPRLDSWPMAGFEFGSGIMCNSHYPEEDAAALRTCILHDPYVW